MNHLYFFKKLYDLYKIHNNKCFIFKKTKQIVLCH